MIKFCLLFLLLIAVAAAVLLYQRRGRAKGGTVALTAYCAAGLRNPVEEIAQQFRRDCGVEIQLQYGGTGTLLSELRLARRGDLFLAADEGAVATARQEGLVKDAVPIVIQHPVVAVRMGNPRKIHTLADLLRNDVKLALANPEAASISRVARAALGDTWTKLAAHAAVMQPSVTEVAGDVSLGTADAAIVWDAMAAQFNGIDSIEIPELAPHSEPASACVLEFAAQPEVAARFARYLAAPDKGGAIFKREGFTPAGGKPWDAPAR